MLSENNSTFLQVCKHIKDLIKAKKLNKYPARYQTIKEFLENGGTITHCPNVDKNTKFIDDYKIMYGVIFKDE
jgi:hypothetical protein